MVVLAGRQLFKVLWRLSVCMYARILQASICMHAFWACMRVQVFMWILFPRCVGSCDERSVS